MRFLYIFFCVNLLFTFNVFGNNTEEPQLKSVLHHLSLNEQLLAQYSVEQIYNQNQFFLLWDERKLEDLIDSIQSSESHGLTPSDYHLTNLTTNNLSQADRDVLATDAYLSLAGHLLSGKLDPISIEPTWTAKGREQDLVSYLSSALQNGSIKASLEQLAPQQPRYEILKAALLHYRNIAADGGWGIVAFGELLKPGEYSPHVSQLRERLRATGDIDQLMEISDFYDESLVEAVKQFQRRANLEPDGVVGPATLQELNRTPQDRVDQLRVNLERWRWLPEDFGEKHLRVNIADYQLEIYEDRAATEVYDVVIGKTYRKTPIFSASMSYIVLNPWWVIPPKLARLDILPKFKKDPDIIDAFGYQVLDKDGNLAVHSDINWHQYSASNFPFRLRQKPGVNNALGQVKFMFPNPHDVYLHDTPTRSLFGKVRRDFSSGCIRVKNPIDLVEWVLADNPEWTRTKINRALDRAKEISITLKKRIPVHLLYWTVVVDDLSQGVRFIDDVYDRDETVLKALNISKH